MKIDSLSEEIRTQIKDACQELFHRNYIPEYVFSPNESLKKANTAYSFIQAHFEPVSELLEAVGWRLSEDSRAGVIYITSRYPSAKVVLTQTETFFLFALRLLYDEKKIQATAAGEVYVTAQEIIERLTTLGALKKKLAKSEREKALRTLSNKNIIARVQGALGDIDVRLAVLPSILCAISQQRVQLQKEALKNAGQDDAEKMMEEPEEAMEEGEQL